MNPTVRRPKVIDLPAMEAIEKANLALFPSRKGYLSSVRTLIERSLAEEPEGVMVAELGGKVVGTAVARTRGAHPFSGLTYGHVLLLSVDPAHQSQKLSERLLRECEAYLRSRGCQEVYLRLPADQNQDAPLYLKSGYAVAAWELQRTFKK